VGCLGQTKVAGPDWGMIRKIDFGLFGYWLKWIQMETWMISNQTFGYSQK
jgi:hypothetical protein